MNKNLLKGFLGSAALLALALNVAQAKSQDDAVSHLAGLNFGAGYAFEVSNHSDTRDKVPMVDLNKETIFGKDAKTKVESNGTFSNLGGVAVKPESFDNDDEDWEYYSDEITAGAYDGSHSLDMLFRDIVGDDDKRRRNMQHSGWLSAGWLYPISGDFFVEPQLTLKVKGTPEKRKVEGSSDVYSQYLAAKIGTSAVEIKSDTKNIQRTPFNEGDFGGQLVKVATIKTTEGSAATSIIDTHVDSTDAKEGFFYKLGPVTHDGVEISGKTVNGNNLNSVLKEKILGSKDASGTMLSQSIYMTRSINFELKNNFEAALHANLGYAFNQHFAVYAKLGMSLDFYKLEYTKGQIEKGIDDYAYDPMNFKINADDVTIANMYISGKDGKKETAVFEAQEDEAETHLLGNKILDLHMIVRKDQRTLSTGEWDKDANAPKPDDQKDIETMLEDAKLSVENADDDVKTNEKNTFVQINADFGLGMIANVYKGLQFRAEFVYSLPMNKEKKMYNENVTLTMKPHKFKFNFGFVVPLNMIMGK